MTAPAPQDVDDFQAALTHVFGLRLEPDRHTFLNGLLRRRLAATGLSCARYLSHLELSRSAAELGALMRELAVSETSFFRNRPQFEAFAAVALPDRLAAGAGHRPLTILSAGCASGEEPYSLAMVARDIVGPERRLSVIGIDANPSALAKAARAQYGRWSFREAPSGAEERWFTPAGREAQVIESVRAMVRFEQRNLVDDDPAFWQRGAFDIVFCRNVLMYLTPASVQAIISRIEWALTPGGYLFLGHAENLRGLSSRFTLQQTNGAFYYRSSEDGHLTDARVLREAGLSTPRVPTASDWIDGIRLACRRVDLLSTRTSPGTAAARAVPRHRDPEPVADWDRDALFGLMTAERFQDALDYLATLPPGAWREPDVRTCHVMLLIHVGRLEAAQAACDALVRADETGAGGHYLLGLCLEAAGDLPAAAHHHTLSCEIDPGFAMPCLHLGLMARRAGDQVKAARALERAATLLEREPAQRLLLFGGGFRREALVALCRVPQGSEVRS